MLDRRGFIVSAGVVAGGMALSITPARAAKTGGVPWGPDGAQGSELSAWIEIAADDNVTIRCPTPEIGNGATTQIAMNVAEELGCDWSKIRIAFAAIHRDFAEGGVYTAGFLPFFGGHSTDPNRMKRSMQLGASARERLKTAAAARWKVPVDQVSAKAGLLTHAATKRSLRYGEVAAEAAKVTLAAEPALKPPSEWTLIGKASPGKLNAPDIVRGAAVYGIDVQVPGMVYAALRQSPVQGGKLKSHKPEAVLKMPGVRAVVVVDPSKTKGSPVKQKSTFGLADSLAQSAVAVIADHYWQAKKALEALPVEWDGGEGSKWASSEEITKASVAALGTGKMRNLKKAGDVTTATGKRVVEAVYTTPLCDNATMEPLNATALVTADSVEVWCPTQDQQQAYWVAIDETGIAPEKVKLHQTYVGGGFGRRTQADDVRMAVAVAKQYPGKPVKLIWSREETTRQGRYRTPITTSFKGVLDDATGYPQAVTSTMCYTATRAPIMLPFGYNDMPYFTSGVIPNLDIKSTAMGTHVLNGAYRAPCYNSHAFIVETFIDECAVAAGIDPLEYRLKLVSKWDKAWADCLKLAADKAGWGQKLSKGEGLGIAISCWPQAAVHAGAIVATVARVAVSQAGEISVKQLDIAFDCGKIANRDAVRAQLEGGALFGLNMTLNEEVTIKDGAIVEGNFDDYPMLRIADAPHVNIHFEALSGQDRFDIIGEAPIGPVGPAVGNAIFAATGKRLRTTPFRKQDLSWT